MDTYVRCNFCYEWVLLPEDYGVDDWMDDEPCPFCDG